MGNVRRSIRLALLLAGVPFQTLDGQIVRGELIDGATGERTAGVALSLIATDGGVADTARTLSAGEFTLAAGAAGSYRIHAEKPGYLLVISSPFSLGTGDTLNVRIRLTEQLVLLDSLTVDANPGEIPYRARGFYDRLQAGNFGIFLTRQEIVALRPARTTDLLRRVPGLVFTTGRGDGFTTRLRGGCAPNFYLDGVRANLGGITIDDLVRPSEIEGIEIYRSVQEAPPEYQGLNAGCSAILIWTRIGNGN